MSDSEVKPKMVRIFFSRASTMGYVFRSGKSVHFMGGQYTTSDPDEIAELEKECNAGHENYFMDDARKEIDAATLDPLHALRESIRAEELAKLRAENKLNDMGSTAQGPLKGIATTANISGLAAASEAQATAAKAFAGPINIAASAGGATATKL